MSAKLKDVTGAQIDSSDVTAQLSVLREDVVSLTQMIADLAQAKGSDLSETAKSQLQAATNAAEARVKRASDQAAQLQSQANDFIRHQPAAALGIAAGLGFLVGFLGRRS